MLLSRPPRPLVPDWHRPSRLPMLPMPGTEQTPPELVVVAGSATPAGWVPGVPGGDGGAAVAAVCVGGVRPVVARKLARYEVVSAGCSRTGARVVTAVWAAAAWTV